MTPATHPPTTAAAVNPPPPAPPVTPPAPDPNQSVAKNVELSTFAAFRTGLGSGHQTTLSPSLTDPTTAGTIMDTGVVIDYDYDAAAKTLTFQVKQHPFYVTVKSIQQALEEAVKAATPKDDAAKTPNDTKPPAQAQQQGHTPATAPSHKSESKN